MDKDYRIGDLVHIPQAVELIDLIDRHGDGAQLSIPLRVQTTQKPIVGIVAEAPRNAGYLMVLCDGDIWSVRTQSVYSVRSGK